MQNVMYIVYNSNMLFTGNGFNWNHFIQTVTNYHHYHYEGYCKAQYHQVAKNSYSTEYLLY